MRSRAGAPERELTAPFQAARSITNSKSVFASISVTVSEYFAPGLAVSKEFGHNVAMVEVPDNQEQPARIVLINDSVEETPVWIPPRRMLGSTGVSLVVHAVILLIFSLVLLSARESNESLHTMAQFEEPGNSEDLNWIEVDTLELPPVQDTATSLRELTPVTISNESPQSPNVDLSRFANQPSGESQQGLPTGIDAIAGTVQKRVAKAGGRTGEVQFSLAWESFNDLDLHVIAPSGEHISYAHRKSRCNGELDVDMNAGTQVDPEDEKFSQEPVENTRWLTRQAPTGRFTILVHQYRWRAGQDKDDFQLLINLGKSTQVVEDTVSSREPISVHRFQYVPSSLSQSRQRILLAQLTKLQKQEDVEATKLLEQALQMTSKVKRDQALSSIIGTFPHTDAAIRAMQEVEGVVKR